MEKSTSIWIDVVKDSVKEIQKSFKINKGLILTEGDLECLLYHKLICKWKFRKCRKCKTSDWKTGYIHSQVTWFKREKESGFEVDLTILNPQNLDINTLESTRKFPNKGFFHDGETVGIEIKFIRDDEPKKFAMTLSAII